MGVTYQYCQAHKKVEEYPSCESSIPDAIRATKNTQLLPSERPIVWQHPQTGEIRHPGRNDGEMPKYYKEQGYVKREFNSYHEHQKFNKEQGLVNHKAEGIK